MITRSTAQQAAEQRYEFSGARPRPLQVKLRLSEKEMQALDAQRQAGESRQDCLKRLAGITATD